jgi:hypothetical protein
MDSEQLHPELAPAPQEPTPEQIAQQRKLMIGAVLVVLIVIGLLIFTVWGLTHPSVDTAKVRDLMIIFMAAESLFIGLTLVVLLVQLARLINLLQNDIKPILDSTNETVNTLRGTVTFLGDNLTEPVMKLNELVAAFGQLRKLLRLK